MADVDVDLFEALHASPILRQRAGKIATRVANNPRTPNRRQLEQEQDALNALARKLEALSDAHFARIKETLQREDHARPSHECGRGCPGWDAGVLSCTPCAVRRRHAQAAARLEAASALRVLRGYVNPKATLATAPNRSTGYPRREDKGLHLSPGAIPGEGSRPLPQVRRGADTKPIRSTYGMDNQITTAAPARKARNPHQNHRCANGVTTTDTPTLRTRRACFKIALCPRYAMKGATLSRTAGASTDARRHCSRWVLI